MILEFHITGFTDGYRVIFDDGTALKASYRILPAAIHAALTHVGGSAEDWERTENKFTYSPSVFVVMPYRTGQGETRYTVHMPPGLILPADYDTEDAAVAAACKSARICRGRYYRQASVHGGPISYTRYKTHGPKLVLISPQTVKTEPLNRFWTSRERTPDEPAWVAPILPLQYCKEPSGGWGFVTLRIQDNIITGDLGGYQIFTRELHIWEQIP